MTDINDTKALREALGTFLTGVTVITTLEKDGTPRGFTANSFSSVSLNPPLVSVCVALSAASNGVFANADGLAINILSEAQRDVSTLFASKRADKFSCVKWTPGPLRNPILEDVVAWFDCRHYKAVIAGDHIVLLVEIGAYHSTSKYPLGYYRGNYFSPGMSAFNAEQTNGQKNVIGGILRFGNQLLLLLNDDGTWQLPTAQTTAQLKQLLLGWGLSVDWGFLFAVFENDGYHSIYYHGQVTGGTLNAKPQTRAKFVNIDDIPYDKLGSDVIVVMMRRYVNEQRQGEFGVYVGDGTAGTVRQLNKMV